jgi:hypothetical protein
MHSGRFWFAFLIAGTAGLCLVVANAYTIPRYSARYGQDCNLCHMNPAGGGQRATYATQYIVPKEMAWLGLSDSTLASIDPQLSKAVTIGADARTLFLWSDLGPNATLDTRPFEDFFQMQGNLYLGLQLTDKFSLYFDKGIGQSSTTPEIYGLGYILPATGWVKVGRFVPDFGWRTPDHTAFVRQYMGFIPPGHTDVGIEAGVNPGNLVLTASVLNGNLGSTNDNDDRTEWTGRALYRVYAGHFGAGLGGSVLWNRQFDQEQTAGGPFGYFQLKPFTWTWEADVSNHQVIPDTLEAVKSFFTSHELAVQLRQGLDLKGTLDIYDPNVDTDTGKRVRYGFGAESMLYPFVRLEAMAYLYRNLDESGVTYPETEYSQFVGQVHFFY